MAIALIPSVYLAVKWETIPEVVPVHFDGKFEPDRYGSRNELWLMVAIITGSSLLTYLLLENLHKIDPKRKGKPLPVVFSRLGTGLAMFFSALCLLAVLSCTGPLHQVDHLLVPMLGFIIAFSGNIMHSLKPNYFAGIRLPWTLNNEENWRKTHQLSGKLWFATGVAMIAAGLLLPRLHLEYVVLTSILVLAAIPVAYSYNLHRKLKPTNNHQK